MTGNRAELFAAPLHDARHAAERQSKRRMSEHKDCYQIGRIADLNAKAALSVNEGRATGMWRVVRRGCRSASTKGS
jgi:hypothetical protein